MSYCMVIKKENDLLQSEVKSKNSDQLATEAGKKFELMDGELDIEIKDIDIKIADFKSKFIGAGKSHDKSGMKYYYNRYKVAMSRKEGLFATKMLIDTIQSKIADTVTNSKVLKYMNNVQTIMVNSIGRESDVVKMVDVSDANQEQIEALNTALSQLHESLGQTAGPVMGSITFDDTEIQKELEQFLLQEQPEKIQYMNEQDGIESHSGSATRRFPVPPAGVDRPSYNNGGDDNDEEIQNGRIKKKKKVKADVEKTEQKKARRPMAITM
jgi:hypothetical protein